MFKSEIRTSCDQPVAAAFAHWQRCQQMAMGRPFSYGSLVLLGVMGCVGQRPESATASSPAPAVDGRSFVLESTGMTASEGAFFTGKYRNVFAELGKTQADIDAKIALAFGTYFSTTDENRIYFEFGADEAYVKDIAHDDIRSEGMSYAMMLTLQRNDRTKFDKLWRFALRRMRIQDPKHPNTRGFAWAVDTAGKICDENSAPDGEEYFAMALYFAHHRWGSSGGQKPEDYGYWANELLDMMKNRPPVSGPRYRRIDTGPDDGLPCTGEMKPDQVTGVPLFDAAAKQIRFNASQGQDWTDPSYHVPVFYNLFALWGPPADASFWNAAAATSRAFLGRAMHPETGLAPEYANYDGTPHHVSWNQNSAKFAYDAWRVGGNVGMDWAWAMQPGGEQRARADALIRFFHAQGPTSYKALWELDGKNGTGSHSPGLVAMNAVATLATTDAVKTEAAAIVEDLWNTALPTGKYRYYDGLLYSFALLHLSGQYVIYKPQ
jgi:oligosaccharide reducing-end xylanase